MSKLPNYPHIKALLQKSQPIPNTLIFDEVLTSAGKILILALNATATCGIKWKPSNEDLIDLLGWTEARLRDTLKECINAGYIRVVGDEYNFDLVPSFAKEV